MSELVALHTQALGEPLASIYLDRVVAALGAARINKAFPERRPLEATLQALRAVAHLGLYDSIYVDARAGLPNLASFTRVLSDREVGGQSLASMTTQAELDARRDEAEVFERQSRKRRYFEHLVAAELAPVDRHRVLLRRHEPAESRASFRVELTKLLAGGCYARVVIELWQKASMWSHKLVQLDAAGEVAEGTEALRGMIYRFADFDAETLFVRLHELEGVTVERVQRGIIGPVLWTIADGGVLHRNAEPTDDAIGRAWRAWLPEAALAPPQLVAAFASDTAAIDVREEASNDPLSPLLSSQLRDNERARYGILRDRHPFKVYKDRKFVASERARPLVDAVCKAAQTKNLIYPLA
ncbi:MAG: hypothetical protein IAG13_23990 [Deltaproteobacteria bacterium]|nr:hypothetical protein [Nannocystaceae bacterium]